MTLERGHFGTIKQRSNCCWQPMTVCVNVTGSVIISNYHHHNNPPPATAKQLLCRTSPLLLLLRPPPPLHPPFSVISKEKNSGSHGPELGGREGDREGWSHGLQNKQSVDSTSNPPLHNPRPCPFHTTTTSLTYLWAPSLTNECHCQPPPPIRGFFQCT